MVMAELDLIRIAVKGCYDLQMLRMQTGLRLASNFRAKLKKHKDDIKETEDGELSAVAQSILDELRESYKMLTSGIARNRTLPGKEGFIGNPLISTYAELVMVHQFTVLEREEKGHFIQLEQLLADVPIFTEYLANVRGIGAAMGGVLVTKFDPFKAQYVSSFWKLAGLDVVIVDCGGCEGKGEDAAGNLCQYCKGSGIWGEGRSRKESHLVERTYTNKDGEEATRMGLTYDPWLKTKLFVLASSFMRSKSPWVEVYRNYKNRISSDAARDMVSVNEWKRRNKRGEVVGHLWTPGRIDNSAKRYMIKIFLIEFWTKWRTMEGLPAPPPYHEGVLGHRHAAE
jgi:hypothetical protein